MRNVLLPYLMTYLQKESETDCVTNERRLKNLEVVSWAENIVKFFICGIYLRLGRIVHDNRSRAAKRLMIYLCLSLTSIVVNSCAQESSKYASIMNRTEQEWKEKLTPEQYYILREKGTERAFTGKFYLHKEKGIYRCAGCGEALFTDEMKFDSHCGWPSFDREIAGGKIIQTVDRSHGMVRMEITCARCGGHLGHIFNDGPTETGMRYCVNSAALTFEPASASGNTDTITLGAGCFWCVEAAFEMLDGVISATSGYSGGKTENPKYKEVCSGNTGHAEVVQVVYDPQKITLEKILEAFFTVHDPTTLNRQGADVGTQYRSAIFYHNPAQKEKALEIIKKLNEEKAFAQPIVTEVTAFDRFYEAEDYHQEYYSLNGQEPYCRMVIAPKLDKFKKIYQQFLKQAE